LAAATLVREQVPAPDEWGQVFGDEVLATAILDRLLHHCEVISINGPSYRLKNRLKAIERENEVA
jgi:DNA replication protein DnaC